VQGSPNLALERHQKGQDASFSTQSATYSDFCRGVRRLSHQQLRLVSSPAYGTAPSEMSHSFVVLQIKLRGPFPTRSAVWSRFQQLQLNTPATSVVCSMGSCTSEICHSFVALQSKKRPPLPCRVGGLVEIQISNSSRLKRLQLLSLSDRNTYLFCCIVVVCFFGIAYLNIALFEMALTEFCLHVMHGRTTTFH
jgi:hypothetical protein